MPWYIIALFLGTLVINNVAAFTSDVDRRSALHGLCLIALAWSFWIMAQQVYGG